MHNTVFKVMILSRIKETQQKRIPPWYNIRGMTVGKAYNIAIPLIELIKDYSDEYNVSQKDIIKVAVIEFLMKYGYREEVKKRLNI